MSGALAFGPNHVGQDAMTEKINLAAWLARLDRPHEPRMLRRGMKSLGGAEDAAPQHRHGIPEIVR